MKQLEPNTPLNEDLNYEMMKQAYAGYKIRSINYINMKLTQIKQQINNKYAKTQNQTLMNINYQYKLK